MALSERDFIQEHQRRIDRFGPNLCSVLIELITEMTDFCMRKQLDLRTISAYSDKSDDWKRYLLRFY